MTILSTRSALAGALAILAPIAVAQAQDTTSQSDTTASQQAVSSDSSSAVQNPQGYRGMERPVNVFPPDSGEQARTPGEVEDHVTGTYDDTTWQDTTGAAQNPAGYRGMERPAGSDTADATRSTTDQKAQKSTKKDSKKKEDAKKAAAKADPAAAAAPDTTQQDTE